MTQPTIPNAPVGVPAWLIRICAAAVGLAGPIVAWIDPNGAIPPGAGQAAVILAFLIVGAAIFLTHLILAAVHEYGWTMNAVTHIDAAAEAEFKQLWPEMKQAYADAKPALDQVQGVPGVIDALSKDVADLKAKEETAGLDPQAVLQAVEAATGTTWPRAAAPAPAASVDADPATAGQAS